MKQPIWMINPLLALLLVLIAAGCIGINEDNLKATFAPSIRATVIQEIAPTLTVAAESKVTLKSLHDQFVIALDERQGWTLGQTPDPSHECAWFTLDLLEDAQYSLRTCYDRFVIAPRTGEERKDWRLLQGPELSDCSKFVLHNLGRDGFALETCAGHFVTAGDGGWPGELAWAIVAETDTIGGWEMFRLEQPYSPPTSVITTFDSCGEPSKRARRIEVLDDPDAGNTLDLSYVQEAGHGCVARIEYEIVVWSALRIELLEADLRPYSQLVFDIRADAPLPDQIKLELKRASDAEISILDVSGITTDWQTKRVNLDDFGSTDYTPPLSTFAEMEELLFTVDVERSGTSDTFYLDNITLQ